MSPPEPEVLKLHELKKEMQKKVKEQKIVLGNGDLLSMPDKGKTHITHVITFPGSEDITGEQQAKLVKELRELIKDRLKLTEVDVDPRKPEGEPLTLNISHEVTNTLDLTRESTED